jgi:hypothetical protein
MKIPKVGDHFILKDDDSPWPMEGRQEAIVLDIKDGWVRFSLPPIFKDNRLKMDAFLYCYELEREEGQK